MLSFFIVEFRIGELKKNKINMIVALKKKKNLVKLSSRRIKKGEVLKIVLKIYSVSATFSVFQSAVALMI